MRLDPSEVDKEAHNVDTMFAYPLEFFEATLKHPGPKDVEKMIEMVSRRLGKPSQYEGFGFTHDTRDIAEGPEMSAYKTIGSMMDKMTAQLELAARIRAVDAPDVAARVIGSHFLPDMMGNLKAFSKQAMRCTKCNAKYRRIPLTGKCRKCGNANLTMTVHEGSVKKYLVVSQEICVRFDVSEYVQQRIEHVSDSIDSVFQNDRVKKARLSDFF
jgi:DNA polymerase II large subunit